MFMENTSQIRDNKSKDLKCYCSSCKHTNDLTLFPLHKIWIELNKSKFTMTCYIVCTSIIYVITLIISQQKKLYLDKNIDCIQYSFAVQLKLFWIIPWVISVENIHSLLNYLKSKKIEEKENKCGEFTFVSLLSFYFINNNWQWRLAVTAALYDSVNICPHHIWFWLYVEGIPL